ncbi:MAG: helix-turn-helix domain-containing protein [Synergistaceae bacterium]|nr:helix-turn-helix domain-containing protein [Synergistaceae bacterium]
MSKQIKENHKHLAQDDRICIEKSLDLKVPFREIAKAFLKDPTTISKEIRLHRRVKPRNPFNQDNNCIRRTDCSMKNVCSTGECGPRGCGQKIEL